MTTTFMNKRVHIAFIILFIAFYSGIKAQDQNSMDCTVYEEKIGSFNLQLIMSDQPDLSFWKTVLTDTVNKKELVLLTDSIVKNLGWKYYESVGEAPCKLYTIGGAMLDNRDLYVILSRFGAIQLYKIHFTDSEKFEISEKALPGYFSLPSYGDMTCIAHFIKIGQDLFLSLCAGQLFGKIDTKLYRIDSNSFDIKEVEFNPNPTVICAIYITEDSKRWMNIVKTYKDGELSKHSVEELKILHQHSEQPYYFKNLDSDFDKRNRQVSQYKIWGFDLKSYWDYGDSSLKSPEIISTAEQNIKQVLDFYGQGITQDFSLLDCINNTHKDPLNNTIYFFCQSRNGLQIVRYDKWFSIWFISDFIEKEVNLQQQ